MGCCSLAGGTWVGWRVDDPVVFRQPTKPTVAQRRANDPDPSAMALWGRYRDARGERCPLPAPARTRCLFGNGPVPAVGAVVGSAPDAVDDAMASPWVGPAGQYLRRVLRDLEMDEHDLYLTYAAKCQFNAHTTDDDRMLEHGARTCADAFLVPELAEVRPRAVLTCGKAAYQVVMGVRTGLLAARGRVVHSDRFGCPVVPTLDPRDVLEDPTNHELFVADVARFRRLLRGDVVPPVLVQVEVCRSLDEVAAACAHLAAGDGLLTFDVETRGFRDYDPAYSRVWLLAATRGERTVGGAVRTFVLPVDHLDQAWTDGERGQVVHTVMQLLAGARTNGHNVKYDTRAMRFLARRHGCDAPLRIGYDSMCAAHLMAEELPLGLEDVAGRELGVDPWGKGHIGFGLKEDLSDLTPMAELAEYCAYDVAYTHAVYEQQRERLRGQQRLARLLRDLVLPGLEAYTQLELNGVWLDLERVRARQRERREAVASLRGQILGHVAEDFRPSADIDNEHFLRRWIFGAPPDGLGLQPVTYTPKRRIAQVSDEVLAQLDHPAMELLREYRGYVKDLQFFEQWLEWVGPDGRLHQRNNLTGTDTGRRSNDKPNLQQVPKDRYMRSCVGAPPGWVWLEVDFSQIEVRIAAVLSGDRELQRIFREDLDVYAATARLVLGAEEVTKAVRDRAKAIVLGLLYGMGHRTLRTYAKKMFGVDFTPDEAERFHARFFTTFPGLLEWHATTRREVRQRLQAESPIGRVRHLLRILSNNKFQVGKAERQAINCVDAATEALSRRGWTSYDRLAEGDEILTKNPITGGLEWQPIQALHVYPHYAGPVYYLRSRSFSAAVTPHHRWLVDRRVNSGVRRHLETRLVETAELQSGGMDKIHRVGTYIGPPESLIDDEVRLLGWVITDGHLKNRRGLGITQSVAANPTKVAEIDGIVERLGLPHHRGSVGHRGAIQWHLHEKGAARYRVMIPEKRLTPELLARLSGRQARLLVDTMLRGDGYRYGRSWRFFTQHEQDADAFVALAVLAGHASTTRRLAPHIVERDYPSIDGRPRSSGGWLVTLLVRGRAQISDQHIQVREEARLMWCPTVANGTFVARRDGHVYITGNSPVQGLGGDLTLASVVVLNAELPPDEGLIVGDIHDAILFQLREDVWRPWARRILEVMEGQPLLAERFGWHSPIRLKAEGKVGRYWGMCNEFTLEGSASLPSVDTVEVAG